VIRPKTARAPTAAKVEPAPQSTIPAVPAQTEPEQPSPTDVQTGARPTGNPTSAAETPAAKPKEEQAKADAGADDASFMTYLVRDPEAFAHNVARMMEGAGKAAAAYLRPREDGTYRAGKAEELTTVFKTLANVGEYWMADPARAFDAQARLWTGYMDIWNRTLKRMGGEAVEPAIKPDARDRRFQDPDWSKNQFFDFVKQMYLMTSRWADQMVTDAKGLDEHTRLKAEFYVKQIADAVAPSNFVMTNPELLRETLAENGENLVRGMQMLAEDIAAGGGDLKIRQTSAGNFKIGENLATTPGKVIYQNDICQIIQYEASTAEVYKRPLLIVPPWINKFYILDLNAEKSFIKWAVAQGRTVFVISWVNPDQRQAEKSFEQYMKEGILTGVDVVEKATGERGVDTIGYCVGGTLLAVTLAWCAATGDDRIKSATFFTTQVDFTHAGDLKAFVDEEQVRVLEESMKERGYLEGQKMASSFNMLRPNDLIWPYFINNYMKGKEPFPFDLLYWNADATRMPAANHSFYLRNCYLDNNLSKGEMTVGGIKLDLSKVKIPVYNLAAREDHIAPARSVFIGSGLFGGPVDYVMSGSGHIAGVINPPAKGKYQFWTGGKPVGEFEDWVKSAKETPGSWWPHWADWVAALAPEKVPAREPGCGRLNAIEDAPGSYVKMKA
jgi:polyhydroxyalkanoate synthase